MKNFDKLEVGRTYKNRIGNLIKIDEKCYYTDDPFPFRGVDTISGSTFWYCPNGDSWTDKESEGDLIELLPLDYEESDKEIVHPKMLVKNIKNPGYHLKEIKKGELGEVSKIMEEVHELEDAISQDCNIMALVELSDLYGAIELFLAKHFPDTSMEDLKIMSKITQRAFLNGRRK